jgi:hypothetical protein
METAAVGYLIARRKRLDRKIDEETKGEHLDPARTARFDTTRMACMSRFSGIGASRR